MEHFFSPNLDEDQKKKKKKGLHQKRNNFFPEIKWTPTLRCTPESNYWGGCRCTPYSTQTTGGDTAKLLGEIYPPIPPPPPRFSAPLLAMKGY